MAKLKLLLLLTIGGILFCYFLVSRSGLYDKHLPTSSRSSSALLGFDVLTHLQSIKVKESSGVVFSRAYPNAVWTHNDSGNEPLLFLVSTQTGEVLIQLELEGAKNTDWEDLAFIETDQGGFVAIGDFGDNYRFRKRYQINLIKEPKVNLVAGQTVELGTKDWLARPFKYKEGSMNCESFAFDPQSNSLILIEKLISRNHDASRVFQLQFNSDKVDESNVLVAAKIGEITGANFSAMDISKDGQQMAIRVYNAAFFLSKSANQTWQQKLTEPLPDWHRLPTQLQGEGICFYPSGDAVLLSSERENSTLIRVALPPSESIKTVQKMETPAVSIEQEE